MRCHDCAAHHSVTAAQSDFPVPSGHPTLGRRCAGVPQRSHLTPLAPDDVRASSTAQLGAGPTGGDGGRHRGWQIHIPAPRCAAGERRHLRPRLGYVLRGWNVARAVREQGAGLAHRVRSKGVGNFYLSFWCVLNLNNQLRVTVRCSAAVCDVCCSNGYRFFV